MAVESIAPRPSSFPERINRERQQAERVAREQPQTAPDPLQEQAAAERAREAQIADARKASSAQTETRDAFISDRQLAQRQANAQDFALLQSQRADDERQQLQQQTERAQLERTRLDARDAYQAQTRQVVEENAATQSLVARFQPLTQLTLYGSVDRVQLSPAALSRTLRVGKIEELG
ncbi:MAG: hypothetical protein RL701_7236 [Pseudomonadota bacterium]|jgi:hypothetical protein